MRPEIQKFQTVIPRSYVLPTLLFLPQGYERNSSQRWPLLLYLHGSGYRGDDPNLVLSSGLPNIVHLERDDFPFILVCPQCPADTWWSDHIPALDILLKDISDRYAVDPHQVSVTGSSMGGFGVWHLGVSYPERFAALVPLCGGGSWFYGFPERVRSLKTTPVWAFHGEDDVIVPPRESAVLVYELNQAGGQARLDILPRAGHDVWRQVYRRQDLWEWMLAQRQAD